MKIGIIGGGINGLSCAWLLAQKGHQVQVYERHTIMNATSRASSKLLHGGLRYLENREFRLVRESLRERNDWIRRVPDLTNPLRLVMPIYQGGRRPAWMMAMGLFLYDHWAGHNDLPGTRRLTAAEVMQRDPLLNPNRLGGGFEFSEVQMDDYLLGLWVAEQAKAIGVTIREHAEVTTVDTHGGVALTNGETRYHDQIVNVAGPWALELLQRSQIDSPHRLDLVRGSHLILQHPCLQAFLFEVPGERRILFVLPWKEGTLVGTTEVRQTLHDAIACSSNEKNYLIDVYRYYFPNRQITVVETFAGLRPLLYTAKDPNKATREFAIHRTGQLTTVLGGKWTTALALARIITDMIQKSLVA
ncbi:MAG: FAD-dependent oxidoreductase [Magnetococcales bacterium]|nr:FAD-dependent oxidoreductase [Magnetococcales bacterium]